MMDSRLVIICAVFSPHGDKEQPAQSQGRTDSLDHQISRLRRAGKPDFVFARRNLHSHYQTVAT